MYLFQICVFKLREYVVGGNLLGSEISNESKSGDNVYRTLSDSN